MTTSTIRSFDVFDTLIGRICCKGTTIFDILETRLDIPGFSRIRRECESCPFEDTYKKIAQRIPSASEKLREAQKLELQLEYDFSFPIWKYMNDVTPEDILISDMYLSESQIRTLLCKHKSLSNQLIVTPGGKASGVLWRNTNITKNIKLHIGDNKVSDYDNPRALGIPANHISNVDYTESELRLSEVSKEFAAIIRAVRLTTQHTSGVISTAAYTILLPMALMICLFIHKLPQKFDHIIFLSRDGYWMHKVFQLLFPSVSSHYMYFSRLLVGNPAGRNSFVDSMNRIKGEKLFIDLHGTGQTFNSLIDNIDQATYLICFTWKETALRSSKQHIMSTTGSWISSFMEDLAAAPHGSVSAGGAMLDPEYDTQELVPYMHAFGLFSEYYNVYSKYVDILGKICTEKILPWFHKTRTITPEGVARIREILPHIDSHASNYITFPLRYYSQIGQDKYYIEQIAKYKCNGIFLDIGAYDGITGSNTYFLEKHLNWKGLLVECNPEIAARCKSVRTSPLCEKALYKESNMKIEFTVPLGKEIVGGNAQLGGISEFLKKESKAYFHDSYKEHKVIQVDTITINDLLHSHAMYSIDYMSLDVEGYELEILKQIDFTKFNIAYITVEHANIPHYQREINEYLLSHGYTLARHNRWDDEYCRIALPPYN